MYSMIILVGLLRMLHVTTADTAPEAPSAGAYLDRCQLAGHDGGIKSGHVTVHSDENSPPPKYRERNCLAPSMAIAEEPKKYSVSMFPAKWPKDWWENTEVMSVCNLPSLQKLSYDKRKCLLIILRFM